MLLSTNKTYKQNITLGIDAGSKHVGMSATTRKKELFSAELRPRNDVVKLLSTRRELRSSRRSRKTRHRKARFLNRVHSKHKGWLAPSVEVKIWNHIQGINLVNKILPLTTIRVETAEFDLQRLKAMQEGKSIPVGKDYQLGEQYNFYNTRQYILHRDGYRCVCCGAKKTKKKGVKFHVHHLESRKKHFVNCEMQTDVQRNDNDKEFTFVTFEFLWIKYTFITHPKTKRLKQVSPEAFTEVGFN